MSLLMKALEKAAKDRGESRQDPPATEPVAATKTPATELTLEPLSADTPAPPARPQETAVPPRAAPQARAERNQQARAAAVMQAGAHSAPAGVSTRAPRIRPVMAIGLAAGLVALGFAVYVYLQITNPALFLRRPAPAATPAPLAGAPQPAPAREPIAIGSVITPAAPAPVPSRVAREEPPPARPAATRPEPAPSRARAPEAPGSSIRISAGSAEAQSDSRLVQAYSALQSGQFDTAQQFYAEAARSDPRNINALLGLATVAMQQGRNDDASGLYFKVLDLEPRNPYAQAGLIAMLGRADPLSAEARLKQLIARAPSAALHFTLGNLYADQSRWAEAQQAYFQAHHLEPANPDYAYNLAVGLEHVGQARLAVDFYRRAVAQAQARGHAGFNLAQAQDRIGQLAAQPQ